MKKAVLVAWIAGVAAMTACAPSHNQKSAPKGVEPAVQATKMNPEEVMQQELQEGPWWSACNAKGIMSFLTGDSQRTKIEFTDRIAYVSTVTYQEPNCSGAVKAVENETRLGYEVISVHRIRPEEPLLKIQFTHVKWEKVEGAGMILTRIKDEGRYEIGLSGDKFALTSPEYGNLFLKKNVFTRQHIARGSERF